MSRRSVEKVPSGQNLQNHSLTSVLRWLKTNAKYNQNSTGVELACKTALEKLLQDGSNDKRTINVVLDMYNRWREFEESVPAFQLSRNVNHVFMPLSETSKNNTEFDFTNKLFTSVYNSDFKFTCAIVKYGPSFEQSDDFNEVAAGIKLLQKFLISLPRNLPSEVMDIHFIVSHARKIMTELKRNNGAMISEGERGFQRCILVLLVLKAVQLKLEENGLLNDYVHCIQLFFEAMPVPFISTAEIRDFLCVILGVPLKQDEEEMIDIYRKLFQSSSTLFYSPRTLKHLCRCTLRQHNARSQFPLPYMIQNLDIPKSLKNFLIIVPDFDN